MFSLLKVVLILLVTSGFATASYVLYNGSVQGGAPKHGGVHGAPGPIVGAGLPLVAVAYGVYWLVKRRRRAD
jgi:hypothetical protein